MGGGFDQDFPEEIIERLHELPVSLTRSERVYITGDGHFRIDRVYNLLGTVGRTTCDALFGGRNRRTIVDGVQLLMARVEGLAETCRCKLQKVQILGSSVTYGIQSSDTYKYRTVVKSLVVGVAKLVVFIDLLRHSYELDMRISAQLCELCMRASTVQNTLSTWFDTINNVGI